MIIRDNNTTAVLDLWHMHSFCFLDLPAVLIFLLNFKVIKTHVLKLQLWKPVPLETAGNQLLPYPHEHLFL